jgi:hypothetical protein
MMNFATFQYCHNNLKTCSVQICIRFLESCDIVRRLETEAVPRSIQPRKSSQFQVSFSRPWLWDLDAGNQLGGGAVSLRLPTCFVDILVWWCEHR